MIDSIRVSFLHLCANWLRTAYCLGTFFLVSGCETVQPRVAPPLKYPVGSVPKFAISYYPYPINNKQVAYPIPRYSGWTDERMGRDLRRFAGIGLDTVLLALSPGAFNDEHILGRIRRFVELSGLVENAPKVAFMIVDDGSGKMISREAIGRWVITSGVRRMPGIESDAGKTVVVVRQGVRCTGVKHPAVNEISAGDYVGAHWHWPSQSTCPAPVPLGGSQGAIVFGGAMRMGVMETADENDGGGMQLLRKNGELLREGLWTAFSMQAPLIIVSSWNDFSSGDFVEPNDLDGNSASDVLTEEIRRVKNQRR